MTGGRYVEDKNAAVELALALAPVVESIAQEIADEIQTTAPRESGDYAESWRAGKAKLDPSKTSVSAIAYSRHRTPGATAPLGVILEYGAVLADGTVIPPQPHIRIAADRVEARRGTRR